MKKLFSFLFALVLSFSIMVTATNAALLPLQDNGGGLIYDPNLNITWYDYTNHVDTWQNQVTWASNLNVGGTTGWRLPTTVDGPYVFGGYDGTTTAGWNITTSEMGYLYYMDLGNKGYFATNGTNPQSGWGLANKGPFTTLTPDLYWSGTEYGSEHGVAWGFYFDGGAQFPYGEALLFYALAVHPGDIGAATVPEPTTMLLLGLGLIGLARVRRRFRQ